QRREHNRALSPNALRPRAKRDPAQERANVVNDRHKANRARRKTTVLLEESRIQILRPVTERIEPEHQQHQKQKRPKVSVRYLQLRLSPLLYVLSARPRRR